MKLFSIFSFVLLLTLNAVSQQILPADLKSLQVKEDSLKILAVKILQGINPSDRFTADSLFTRGLVRALKTTNSFNYPFDSLFTISQLYAPDSTFKIFTWQMVINENIIRQHGAIQFKTTNGALKLLPLIDKSDITEHFTDTVANNYGWMGAVYYKIILTTYKGQKYYTLLGFDENNIRSDKKIIEVLRFENDEPVFGGAYFGIEKNNADPRTISRYVMEFKKDASPRLTYDADLNMIILEHLISESNEPNKKWTLIPDGDYEGFKWVNGKWVFVNKIFNEVTPEGKTPVPVPLNENKLNVPPQ